MCESSGKLQWLVASQTSEELILPRGHGRVAPISCDDVAAAVTAVAAKPDESHIIYTEIEVETWRLPSFVDAQDLFC